MTAYVTFGSSLENHAVSDVASVQGLALMGELKQSTFLYFGDKVQLNMGELTQLERDSYSYRIFVLAHLTYDDIGEKKTNELMTECAPARSCHLMCYAQSGFVAHNKHTASTTLLWMQCAP
jgi:hypothetical protein